MNTVSFGRSGRIKHVLFSVVLWLQLRIQSQLKSLSLIFLLCFSQAGHAIVFDPTINRYACGGTSTTSPKLGFHDVGYGVKLYRSQPAIYYVTRSVVPPGESLGPEGLQLLSQGWTVVNNCTQPRIYWDQYLKDGYFPSLFEYILPFGAGPKNNGQMCSAAGSSLNSANGNNHQKESDSPKGSSGIAGFQRYYNSSTSFAQTADMGSGWTNTFSRSLTDLRTRGGRGISIARPDGKVFYFTLANGAWVPDADVRLSLEELLDASQQIIGWRVTSNDNAVEEYDATGKLITITDIQGRQQTLTYIDDRLDRVETNTGDFLQFAYSAQGFIESVTDKTNRVWKYQYDTNNNLEFVSQPDSTPADDTDNPRRQYHYNEQVYTSNKNLPHALTGITDERGIRYATYEYIADGRAKASYKAGNVDRIDIGYNDTNNTRTVTNSLGDASTYSITSQLGTALVTDITGPGCSTCGSGDTSFIYDPLTNNLLSKTVNGITTKYGNYNDNGNYRYKIEAFGTPEARRTDYTYDPRFMNKILTITEASVFETGQKVTSNSYDDFANMTSITISGHSPDGTLVSRTTNLKYDGPFHQLSFIDGPRTDVDDHTSLTYYSDDVAQGTNRARLKEVMNANNVKQRFNIQYSATGKVLSEQRPNGITLNYTYYTGNDRLETLTQSNGANSSITRWTYLPTGEVNTVIQAYDTPVATTLTYGYDDARRLKSITDNLGNAIVYVLDTEGNRAQETTKDPDGTLVRIVDYMRETLDGVTTINANAAGSITQLVYDAVGNLTSQTDPNENPTTTHEYDSLNRLTETLDALTGSTTYNYDVNDRVVLVNAPNDAETTYTYDDLGNVMTERSPDRGVRNYRYNSAGNLVSLTDARNVTTYYSYDVLGRVITVDHEPEVASVEYEKTAIIIGNEITFTYDVGQNCTNGIGRLCRMDDKSGNTEYAYDPFGNIVSQKKAELGIVYTTQYAYDVGNNLMSIIYPSGRSVTMGRDEIRRTESVTTRINGVDTPVVSSISYRADNLLTSQIFGNGVPETRQYDTQGRVKDISRNLITENGLAGRAVRNDFNADGHSDVLFRNVSGNTSVWLVDDFNMISTGVAGFSENEWMLAASGDFNGDGTADILWRRTTDGENVIYFIKNGRHVSGNNIASTGVEYHVAGIGDFNADGTDDILWRDTTSGTNMVSFIRDGQTIETRITSSAASQWSVRGTGDFNADGVDDILWRALSGAVAIWLMRPDGIPFVGKSLSTVNPDWKIVDTGDFNGDGVADLLWRHILGTVTIWQMGTNGLPVGGHPLGAVALENAIVATGDYDGDGADDILWRNNSGLVTAWKMVNMVNVSEHTLGTQINDWQNAANEQVFESNTAQTMLVHAPVYDLSLQRHLQTVAANVQVNIDQGMMVIVPNDALSSNQHYTYYVRTLEGENWQRLDNLKQLSSPPGVLVSIGKGYLDVWEQRNKQSGYRYRRINAAAQLTEDSPRFIKASLSYPNSSIDSRVYNYDPNGNVIDITSPSGLHGYGYDALDRLTGDAQTGIDAIGLDYDANGNRSSRTQGASVVPYNYKPNSNVLSGINGSDVTYDTLGNRTSDRGGNRHFIYNDAGRLLRVYEGAVTKITYKYGYTYNALGQRTRKRTANGTTVYHYDLNGQIISETGSDGQLIRDYVWRDTEPVAQIDVAGAVETVSYLHTDHLLTPRLATDASGVVVWRWQGEAFGNTQPSGSVTVNLRFPGQYYDSETGLHYNWNRYYEPSTGRYITSDPIGLDGGLNTFGYVGGNPLQHFDTNGLAYFASRPLGGNRWYPWGGSCNPIDDLLNTEISHEQLFFEDGKSPSNIGFFDDGTLKEEKNPTGYRSCRSEKYNDCIMRKAVDNVPGGFYCLLGKPGSVEKFNCQDWADKVREEYKRLETDNNLRQECGLCESQ